MRRLRWTTTALRDMEAATDYMQGHLPMRGPDLLERVIATAENLPVNFQAGSRGEVDGTMELKVAESPFTLVYKIEPEYVDVLALLHQHRRWY